MSAPDGEMNEATFFSIGPEVARAISVVIPAHNEGKGISRCLGALLSDARPGEVEVFVVCNGCTDDTEAVARSFGSPVVVLDTPLASKTASLNLGDRHASGFPRFYVDADVEFTTGALRDVAAVLRQGRALAASPGLHVDTAHSSRVVQGYYRYWTQLPSVRHDLVGRGVYALSEEGRRRFSEFPDIIADDHFVRGTFAGSERISVNSCRSTVRAPNTTEALIRRKVRVYVGNRQAESRLGANPMTTTRVPGWLAVLFAHPRRVFDLPFYAYVVIAAKQRARRLEQQGLDPAWERDDSRDSWVSGF